MDGRANRGLVVFQFCVGFYDFDFAPHIVGYHVVHRPDPEASLEYLPMLQNWYDGRGNSLAEDYR
jgi:hypothetical protein